MRGEHIPDMAMIATDYTFSQHKMNRHHKNYQDTKVKNDPNSCKNAINVCENAFFENAISGQSLVVDKGVWSSVVESNGIRTTSISTTLERGRIARCLLANIGPETAWLRDHLPVIRLGNGRTAS